MLARATNEILASITVPLRRQKLEEQNQFKEKLDKLTDEAEKNAAIDENKAVAAAVELSVWLKDFPKSADDFKEFYKAPEGETAEASKR